MPDPGEKEGGAQFERRLNVLGSIIAPATLLGALLFYFGYVSSRAQYDYFGIDVDVDVIGLSTQDYVMRSPQPLMLPLLVFALVGAALIAWHAQIRRRSSRAGCAAAVRRGVVVGLVILVIGVVALLASPLLAGWGYYPLVTPLVLALGGAIAAYSLGTVRFLARTAGASHRPPPGVVVLLWAAVAACVFWATATVAQWSGLGLAQQQARRPDNLPSVIVDTEERLFLPDEERVNEIELPASADETFRFRYWGLRLLIVGGDRMFLIPNAWDNHNTTLVLPLDGSVRLQFQFRNLEP
ncbi:hypothetical protein [Cryobacterium levicorallinum]|uniref:DUF5671 domain-containing protein n=1 Tax=Cryobacterium levicorallinum TaxID=995038 RepID=A0ABY1ED31_9MICO|nr:hypothetical protein [Cryobacterium levicorallinum]GEP26629.1 hypothetical protein CLE01_12270 [Cryobacterium levicorallinum]SFH48419.1 hypothetical protein SAMN05216274_10691 [Cryobacterium levicorallinum]